MVSAAPTAAAAPAASAAATKTAEPAPAAAAPLFDFSSMVSAAPTAAATTTEKANIKTLEPAVKPVPAPAELDEYSLDSFEMGEVEPDDDCSVFE